MNVFYPSIFKENYPAFQTQLKGVNLLWRKGVNFIGISIISVKSKKNVTFVHYSHSG